MKESSLVRSCAALAARRGYWLVKLWPLVTGLPDGLLFVPGGTLVLIEFKTIIGVLSPRQRWVHARLAKLGHHVEVVRTRKAFEKMLDKLLAT